MLTDDDLTRQLGAAYRDTTEDLAYAGRVPTPRTGATLGVPLVATVAATAALATVWVAAPDSGTPSAPPVAGPSVTPTPVESDPELTTDTFEIAGLTFAVSDRVWTIAEMQRIRFHEINAVPEGAREVPLTEPARGWVGIDAESGDAAIYVESPYRFHGRLIAMISPDVTEAEMEALLLAIVT